MLPEQKRNAPAGPPRRGITLIELLVVMFILLMLTTVALPMLQPDDDSRRIREAARMVNVYLSSARLRAMETGRPCGVAFQRAEGNPNAAFILRQAEVPPPYAGDTTTATAQAQVTAYNSTTDIATLTIQFESTSFTESLVQVGDLIRLNHQGRWMEIATETPATPSVTTAVDLSQGGALPWPDSNWSAPVPYEIMRQPRATSVAAPLQLPTPVVVDLFYSGMDPLDLSGFPSDSSGNTWLFGTTLATDATDPMVLFSPNGSLDVVYFDSGGVSEPRQATTPVYVLIGTNERVHQPGFSGYTSGNEPQIEDELPNWVVPISKWISVSPQTGVITTEQNRYYGLDALPGGFDWNDATTWAEEIYNARTYAREAQNMGGR